jgi:putative ATP-dependent endonuclease of OLD family
MLLTCLRIQNYRCFDDVTIRLGPQVLLIGENDTGKSALLHLLAAIFGAQRIARFSPEDLYTEVEGEDPEKRDPLEIELEFRPEDPVSGFTEDECGFFSEQFDVDDMGQERLRMRVRYFYDTASEEFRYEATFMKRDGPGAAFTTRYAKFFGFYLMDAQRDLQREVTNRSGLWGRLMAALALEPEIQARVREHFSQANQALLEDKNLSAMRSQFQDLIEKVLGLDRGAENVRLTPVSQDLAETLRGTTLHVRAKGSQAFFPLQRHGVGAQSAAVIALFRTYLETLARDHVMFGFEEPEAHLHPHAQRYLYRELLQSPAQLFITTHSPCIAQGAHLSDILLLRRKGPRTDVRQLPASPPGQPGPPLFDPKEAQAIRRHLDAGGADIFFCRCALLVEGDSEREAVPMLARALGVDLDQLGISLIAVDSADNFKVYFKLCAPEAFDIPWVAQVDGDAIQKVAQQLRNTGYVSPDAFKQASREGRLVEDVLLPHRCLPLSCETEGCDFEGLLLNRGFVEAYKQAIADLDGPQALTQYIQQRSHSDPRYASRDEKMHVQDYIDKKGKPRFARRVAEISTQDGTDPSRIPQELRAPITLACDIAQQVMRGEL